MRKIIQLLLIALFTCVIAGGCSKSEFHKQLADIDLLLQQQKNEEACKLLNKMNPEVFEEDEECYAFYWLLKMRTDVRLGNDIQSVEPLRSSISYYTKTHDEDKLVWCYYYMGYILDDLNERTEAIVYLKKGEALALKDTKKRTDILHHIYQCLTYINVNSKEYELAKLYGRLALRYSFLLHNYTDMASNLLNMSAIYGETGNRDSAFYYTSKIIPLLDSIPQKKRYTYYGSIGMDYLGRDNEKAKEYLLKSIEKENDPYSCKALAQVYTKEGNKEKADEMWHKALDTKDLSLKANVVKGMAKAKTEEGDYKAAHELDLWAAALKDSLHRQQKEENLKGQQELFEKELANEQLREKHGRAAWVIAALLLSVAILAIWTVRKKRNNRRRMAAMSEELEQKARAMEQLQQENESNKKQLDRLSRDMTGFEQKHEKLLAEGQRLYESIAVDGGNTLTWTKDDFVHFVLYYKLRHPEFVRHVESDYDELTPRQKTFLILYDMGMTDEDVMRTLVLTESSVRANKTRIKGKEVGERQQSCR